MSAARELKGKQIEEIKAKIQSSNSMVVLEYKGITVAEDTAMRAQFRAQDVEYRVLKNRLFLKALKDLGIEGFDSHLEGTTAVAFAHGDALAPAKIVAENAKKIKALQIKCGMMDGGYIGADVVEKLASIPSKEVLLAQLLGMLQSPLSALARVLSEVAKKQEA